MKKTFFTALTAAAVGVCTVFLCACNNNGNGETTTAEPYSYNPRNETSTTVEAAAADPEKAFSVNNSWQNNFKVTYEYYNSAESTKAVTVKETKNSTAFTAEYPDGDSVLYYKANGADTDYYVIMTGTEKSAVHSHLTGSAFSDLSSTFMKLTKVSRELPSLSNVMYMYDEEVGGRACHKYLQRAYTDGKLTDSVYIWIDIEFGFAAKCESYNADGKMRLMWKTDSFETGTVGDDDIKIDLSQYSVREEETK